MKHTIGQIVIPVQTHCSSEEKGGEKAEEKEVVEQVAQDV